MDAHAPRKPPHGKIDADDDEDEKNYGDDEGREIVKHPATAGTDLPGTECYRVLRGVLGMLAPES